MIIINCKECKSEIKTFPSRLPRKKYCSKTCRSKNNVSKFKIGHVWVGKLRSRKRKSGGGYLEIYYPDHPHKTVRNSVREHRLVMEKHLGRYLKPEEIVHHINGNKLDNRIENLQLFSSQSEHIKIAHPDAGIKTRFKPNKKHKDTHHTGSQRQWPEIINEMYVSQ